MTQKNARTGTGTAPLRGAALRDARLKVALKANMARRKAQAKQRGAGQGATELPSEPQPGETDVADLAPGSGLSDQREDDSGKDGHPDDVSGSQTARHSNLGIEGPLHTRCDTEAEPEALAVNRIQPDHRSGT